MDIKALKEKITPGHLSVVCGALIAAGGLYAFIKVRPLCSLI